MTYIKDMIKLIVFVQFMTFVVSIIANGLSLPDMEVLIDIHKLVLSASLGSAFILVPLLKWWMK